MLDSYIADSLKGTTKDENVAKRSTVVVAETAMPSNVQSVLRVGENKTELFKLLSEALLNSFDRDDKQLIITYADMQP